jgi:hypothetical protein
MHESLIYVSNRKFYSDEIETGYKKLPEKKFFGLESPFMFIDVAEAK